MKLLLEELFEGMLLLIPDEDSRKEFDGYRGQMLAIYKRNIDNRAVGLLNQIFMVLYSDDRQSLKRDVIKTAMLDGKDIVLSMHDRNKLLKVLLKAVLKEFSEQEIRIMIKNL